MGVISDPKKCCIPQGTALFYVTAVCLSSNYSVKILDTIAKIYTTCQEVWMYFDIQLEETEESKHRPRWNCGKDIYKFSSAQGFRDWLLDGGQGKVLSIFGELPCYLKHEKRIKDISLISFTAE